MSRDPQLQWTFTKDGTWEVHFEQGYIWFARRPGYCDRGRWLAHVTIHPQHRFDVYLDEADLWPRYYFDLERGMLECTDWLVVQKIIRNSKQLPLPEGVRNGRVGDLEAVPPREGRT